MQAIVDASADDTLILQTQIARTFGLRRQFFKARSILSSIGINIATAAPEVQIHYSLELGRTYASAAHPADMRTSDHDKTAREHYLHAFQTAKRAGLDALAIDALHMMPIVDADPSRQLAWNQKAIAFVEQSTQPESKRWEGALRNNVGYAKHLLGEYDEALRQFRLSLEAYQKDENIEAVRIAHWMIAWTYRAQKRYAEAIDIQLSLEREWHAVGKPDPYVFEELQHLYCAINNQEKEYHYREKFETAAPDRD